MNSPQAQLARKRKQVTMQDVGSLVGVSAQTVSAVINGKPGITSETTARVLAAIEQLGYRPHYSARSLVTGRTNTLALFIFDVSMPVAGKIATATEKYAYAHQYNVILYNTEDILERELAYVDEAIGRSVDGAVFMPANDDSRGPQMLVDAGIPVVTIARRPRHYAGPSLVLNNFRAGELAGQHLAALGHTRIACVAGPGDVHTSIERTHGLRKALAGYGIAELAGCVEARGWTSEAGDRAMRELIDRGVSFTAVYVAGDGLAIGAMHALDEAGRRVPEDVSLISVDDIDLAAYLKPPLTTVRMPVASMAERCVQLVLDALNGAPIAEERIVIEPSLVLRRSTARLAGARPVSGAELGGA
jgi:DNA-binding LacI/PurR family transcriptional regulator